MNKSLTLRNEFLEFFKEKGHTIVPSSPVVTSDDPTLLFTNAGMNQFKDVFLDQGSRDYTRAVDSQKCLRVSGKLNDLEEVGHSPYHHTFFEMLGNWSFGDYYKRDAIKWAWELVTKVWGIDPNRLFATIYNGDNEVPPDMEARQFWLAETKVSPKRISQHGADNFWEMGEIGPCGPCSELHYDLGEEFCTVKDDPNHKCEVNGDCGRIIELWNLVFIQYYRDENGKLNHLPRRHVDTGAGFERFLMVKENVASTFETELFQPLISTVSDLSGVQYDTANPSIPHRVAADHVRALAFALADGALPSNEGRGYVLRRILRRAARFGREIGLETAFLYKLIDPLIETMGEAYPELHQRKEHIEGVIKAEEDSFIRTIGKGLELFAGVVNDLESENKWKISGDDAFKLYDTYGFPLDLTELMAKERNLSVDIERFNELMGEQRVKARGTDDFKTSAGEFSVGHKTEFIGYENLSTEAEILAMNESEGSIELLLDKTPFYSEAGGQVSDQGWIRWDNNSIEIDEVFAAGDAIIHAGSIMGESPEVGAKVNAEVNPNTRKPTQLNHTATHLLHRALHTHVGDHAKQAGSLVAPDRLRFDFTHFEKVPQEVIESIEQSVNDAIREDYQVINYQKRYKQAVEEGITALFGEKYGDEVRVVHIGPEDNAHSRELCGGTHTNRTGEIGLFRILTESAVSAGVRRIEAITGKAALDQTLHERNDLREIKELLSSHGSGVVEKLQKTLEEKKTLEKEHKSLISNWAANLADSLIETAVQVEDIHVVTKGFSKEPLERLKLVGDAIRSRNMKTVALLTSPGASLSGHLCCVVSDDLLKRGSLKAGDLVKAAAEIAGGGGGGKPHMATAGTKKPLKLHNAILAFPQIVKEALGRN